VDADKLKSLERKVDKALRGCGCDVEFRQDYSGRGMFGRVSSLAFVAHVHPCTEIGDKLRDLGLSWDSMGKDWVWYTKY
jgi:hypothetical protein